MAKKDAENMTKRQEEKAAYMENVKETQAQIKHNRRSTRINKQLNKIFKKSKTNHKSKCTIG